MKRKTLLSKDLTRWIDEDPGKFMFIIRHFAYREEVGEAVNNRFRRLAEKIVREHGVNEVDIFVQDCITLLCEKIDEVREPRAIKTFAAQVISRHCLDKIKRMRRHDSRMVPYPDDLTEEYELGDWLAVLGQVAPNDPLLSAIYNDLMECLNADLNHEKKEKKIGKKQNTKATNRDDKALNPQLLKLMLEGYDAQEIAETLGISPDAVRTRESRLRKVLRDRLTPILKGTSRVPANRGE